MAGKVLSDAQIIALWLKAGGPVTTAPMALARAKAESSGRADVTSSNPDGGTNVGVWQLDTPGGVGHGYSIKQLQDPLTNAKITVKATRGGRDWSSWSGNYQPYLSHAQQTVSQFQQRAAAHGGGLDSFVAGVLAGILPGGAAAAKGAENAIGQILQLPSQVTDFLKALEQPVQGLMWFLDPANWARIVAGVFGFLLLGAGLVTIGLAAT